MHSRWGNALTGLNQDVGFNLSELPMEIARMPVISRFYGIVIGMYFNDHNPPQFYANYPESEALFDFRGNIIEGGLPQRALRLVAHWIELHEPESSGSWERARHGEPLKQTESLD